MARMKATLLGEDWCVGTGSGGGAGCGGSYPEDVNDPANAEIDIPAIGGTTAAGPRASTRGGGGAVQATLDSTTPAASSSSWPWLVGLVVVGVGGVIAYGVIKNPRSRG